MTKYSCKISTSSWFYYKEISFDAARSHERKINFSYSVMVFIYVTFTLCACSQKYQKAPVALNTPVRLSARLIVAIAGRIFVKFGIAGF